MTTQWAEIASGLVVVATEDRAWLHRPHAGGLGDCFAQPMTGSATLRSTRSLLDGAWIAARSALVPEPEAPITPARWAWRLAWSYHTAHWTPILMAEARTRFMGLGRRDLAESCARQVEEETGHDELALSDLRALGFRAEAVVEVFRPPTPLALVDYFAQCVRSDAPAAYLGYTYALERSSMAVSREYVESVERALPAGVKATRCMRVHSAIGVDSRHVAETIEVVAGLCPEERFLVARACYETTSMMQERLPGDEPPEGELEEKLRPLRLSH